MKILGIAIVGALLCVSSMASASHEPVEFGKERSERVTMCFTKEAMLAVIGAEVQFVKDGNLEPVQRIFLSESARGNCIQTLISYTTIKTACQFPTKGRHGKDAIRSILSVEYTGGNGTGYVFVTASAPAPDARFDICKAAGLY